MSISALQWTEISIGIFIALVVATIFWVPYLIKEIRDGKRELGPLRRPPGREEPFGPRTPSGAGDARPGTRENPAPGQPDAQADPYSNQAQRDAPPIRS